MNFNKIKTIVFQSLLIIAFMLLVLGLIGFGGYLIWTHVCMNVLTFITGVLSFGLGLFFLNFIRKEADKL
jgi:hypothetical protein